jgi:hypothetical protein
MRLPFPRKNPQSRRVLDALENAPSLAASARPRRASKSPASRPKNRVGVFCRRPPGRPTRCRRPVRAIALGCEVRSYETVSGRPFWLSRDPIGEDGGINLYDYVGNNPINRIDPLGLMAPPAFRGPPPPNFSDVIVPTYGNWGGPDYSGGWRPSQHNGQNGPGAPIDSMDQYFMQHDNAYGKYGITPSTPNSNCDQIQDPCERKKCKEKRKADNNLYREVNNLPDDPSQWPSPAPSPNYARAYRWGVLNVFPMPGAQ